MANNTNKPLEAEVRDGKNTIIKRGLVAKLTSAGAYVYDPKEPKKETADAAEWFPFSAPNGTRTNVFDGDGNTVVLDNK